MSAGRLTSAKKLELLKKVLDKKASVTTICQKAGISRKTFYQWLKKYKERPQLGHHALKVRRPKGNKHWRSISREYQKLILEIVSRNPQYSVGKIIQELPKTKIGKPIISHFGVQRFLERRQLNTLEKRKEFAQFRRLVKRLPATKRLNVIERVLKGEQAIQICREYGISRKTFYKWLKRYLLAREKPIEALLDQNPKGEKHWKAIPQDKKQQIIDIILTQPELSIHKIFARLPWVEGKPLVGYYGLQKILEKEGLNTLERRLDFARARAAVAPPFVPAPPPEIPPSRLRFLLAPFATIPKKIWSTTPGKIFYGLFALFAAYILEVDKLILSGMIFAIISLFFGLIFFLYASKYYMSLAIVLSFSTGQERKGEEENQGRLAKFFSKISRFLPKPKSPSRMTGLAASLEEVKLKHYPFVSIHLPFYNEKRVAERILKACLAFEYPPSASSGQANYEVVVVDDSTDETTEICQRFAQEDSRIRLIHREDRSGFKGGALREALRASDPRTEYVCIFDADFIPFPDTLEQFVKTFQVLRESSQFTVDSSQQENTVNREPLTDNSRIAAVQGYQWHVLNKSENWITRGVRTEYAGSYVVERSGIEVYGGLKMIAGSVYMIRASVLRQFGWGTSITEDFELTLRLYEKGYKVVYTPYIQTPAECVSTIRRLIRQRMRWAEGHSHNVKSMFSRLLGSAGLTVKEKLEFIYLAPYYLQATFFMIGTISWFLAEAVFKVRLPFWSAALGWSLVFTNFISLPLMNIVGLFLEESEEKDYLGIISFILLSYIVVPFQGYAAVKGLLEKEEGPWFRTPKTGLITDVLTRGRFFRFFRIFSRPPVATQMQANGKLMSANERILAHSFQFASDSFPFASSLNPLSDFKIRRKSAKIFARVILCLLLTLSIILVSFSNFIPIIEATNPPLNQAWYLRREDVGQYTSIWCDSAGTDCKISYQDVANADLKFVDCDNANCSSRTITRIDSTGSVGRGNSIWCDSAGTDCKISYYDYTNGDLKFADCADASCSTSTLRTVDSTPDVGKYTSISCPTADDCKISYYNYTNSLLKFADCADASCSTNTLTTVDTADGGTNNSISCPTADDCKISYYDITNADLKFADCADASCSTNTLTTVDSTNSVGTYSSISCAAGAADCKIAYHDGTNGDLKFSDCNDASCSTKTITTVDLTATTVGEYTSIACDSAGTDCKISYYDATNYDLKLADCADASCSTKTLTTVDSTGDVGQYTSISCPTADDCKISYFDGTNLDLKFADCNDASCSSKTTITLDGNLLANTTGSVTTSYTFSTAGQSYTWVSDKAYPTGGDAGSLGTGIYTFHHHFTLSLSAHSSVTWNYRFGYCLVSDNCATKTEHIASSDITYTNTSSSPLSHDTTASSSLSIPGPQSSKFLYLTVTFSSIDNFNGAFADCADASCSTSTLTTFDTAGTVGLYNSISCPTATDCKISYYDGTNNDLKFADCNDASCSTKTLTTVDGGLVKYFNSISCAAGAADCKISYYDDSAKDLKFADCADASCSTSTLTTVDSTGSVGRDNSIWCDSAGTDCKIAYHDTNSYLRFADCNDASCSTKTLTTVDTTGSTIGYKISISCPTATDCKISHYRITAADLKFADCADASCSTSTLTTVDSTGSVGRDSSISCPTATDCKISYHDGTGGDLRFADCADASCSTKTLTTVDSTGSVGLFSSISCAAGVADCKIAYYDSTNYDLKFADCADASCSTSTLKTVDSTGDVGSYNSISCPTATDCKISYYDQTAPQFSTDMNNSGANPDSYITVPALTVSEKILIILPFAYFLPRLFRRFFALAVEKRRRLAMVTVDNGP